MKVIACLTDKKGLLFNHRRCSRDKVVIADIKNTIGDCPLWMNEYSAPLFDYEVQVDNDFLQKAEGGYVFVENVDVSNLDIDEIIVYWWNENYPADFYFTVDLDRYTLVKSEDIEGNSHDCITKHIYKREAA